MANGEKKGDVARAVIAHVLNVTATSPAEKPRPGIMIRSREIGAFSASRAQVAGHFELVDVWQGRKVFSARRLLNEDGWEIVNFKRGDWESGFLCAA